MADHSINDAGSPDSKASSNTKVHPLYSDQDADIVLQSDDGTQFRVHSLIMKMSSRFFRDMLGLPGSQVDQTPIMMAESSATVDILLSLIYPSVGIAQIDPVHIWDVLKAADKYDMPSVMITMRHLIGVYSRAGDIDPIKTYAYACRHDWEDVAKAASTRTFDVDLSSLSAADISVMDSVSLFSLQSLHRSRRDTLLELMDIEAGPESTHIVFHRCGNKDRPYDRLFDCCAIRSQSQFWIVAKHMVSREMETCASGHSLRSEEFWNRPELAPLWKVVDHPGCGCGRGCMAFDKKATMQEVLRVLDSHHLPLTV